MITNKNMGSTYICSDVIGMNYVKPKLQNEIKENKMKKIIEILLIILFLLPLGIFGDENPQSKKSIHEITVRPQSKKVSEIKKEFSETVFTPNLVGRNVPKEGLIIDYSKEVPATIGTNVNEIICEEDNRVYKFQELKQMYGGRDGWSPQIPIYTESYDQKAPNLACDNDGNLYCAFENYDNALPNTFITIYKCPDGEESWGYFGRFSDNNYDLLLPSITYADGYIFTLFHYNNTIGIYRKPIEGGPGASFCPPTPPISPPNIIHRARLCSDSESFDSAAYLYLAYLYGSGSNLELYFTRSTDEAENWSEIYYINDVYLSYQTWDVGIDYGDCGLFIAYFGTGPNQNKVMGVKSTNYGSSWSSPTVIYNNSNNKFGPVVAAHDNTILVVYQYEFSGTDNDIMGTYTTDCGASWNTYFIASSSSSDEELPWVAHDNVGNFCVTYDKDRDIYAEIGANTPWVSDPVHLNSSGSNLSNDDYTTVIGFTDSDDSEGACAAWVEGIPTDCDIWSSFYPYGQPNLTTIPDEAYYDYNPDNHELEIGCTVINDGTATANSGHVGYYLSPYNDFNEEYFTFLSHDGYGDLEPGETSEEHDTNNVCEYGLLDGWYYIYCYIDCYNEEPNESNESDNLWCWTADSIYILCIGIGEEVLAQNITKLYENYPNPFNLETTISFSLAKDVKEAIIEIYNIKGQKIKTISGSQRFLDGSKYTINWNGKDESGNLVSPGIYFYRLEAGEFTATRKMLIIR